MEINSELRLSGFTRIDRGTQGAIFVRYQTPPEEGQTKLEKSPMYYGGENCLSYNIFIPKPKAPKLIACAIVTRSSRNCYTVAAFSATKIKNFHAISLLQVQSMLTDFFQGG